MYFKGFSRFYVFKLVPCIVVLDVNFLFCTKLCMRFYEFTSNTIIPRSKSTKTWIPLELIYLPYTDKNLCTMISWLRFYFVPWNGMVLSTYRNKQPSIQIPQSNQLIFVLQYLQWHHCLDLFVSLTNSGFVLLRTSRLYINKNN